jgi:uncharacterized protein YjiS (DUF1127 family)
MTSISHGHPTSAAVHASGSFLSRCIETLHVWQERSHARKELAQLSKRMLCDIGMTPGDALDEINRPFWRA